MDVSFSVMVVGHTPTPTRSKIILEQVSIMVKEMWLKWRQMRMSCGSGMRLRSGSSRWRWDWQKRNGNKPVSVLNCMVKEIQCQFYEQNMRINLIEFWLIHKLSKINIICWTFDVTVILCFIAYGLLIHFIKLPYFTYFSLMYHRHDFQPIFSFPEMNDWVW